MPPPSRTTSPGSSYSASERRAASVVWVLSGMVIGAVALIIDTMIDGFAFALIQHIAGREACVQGFNSATIFVMLGIAIFSSLFIGHWLFGLRRWVGTKVDADHAEWGELLRSRFATGAMLVFVAVTPLKWLIVLSWANCFGD